VKLFTEVYSPLVPKKLVWSVRLLAALGGAGIISTGECEPVFIFVFLSFFLLGFKIQELKSFSKFIGRILPVLAWLVFFIAIVDFLYLSNSFLLAVAHFLLSLQGLQLLVLRTHRENLGCILISSMMILSSATLAVEWTFFLFLLLFLPVLIWTLILFTFVSDYQKKDASASEKDQEEEVAALQARLQETFLVRIIRQSAILAFVSAVFCCEFVFIVFPRFNFQGFRGQFLQPVQKTGFTSQVDLRKSGKIFEDNSIVMRIEIKERERKKWPGYIRGSTLEIFDGRLWKKAPYTPHRVFRNSQNEVHLPLDDLRGEKIQQTIYLESMDSPILFAAPNASVLKINRPILEVTPDGTFQRVSGDSWRLRYEVISILTSQKGPSPFILPWPRNKGLFDYSVSLPENRMYSIEKLSQELRGSENDRMKIILAYVNYLSKNFNYSLDLPSIPTDESPLDNFLFQSKKGHCEYFASALCLLLRYQNIPARIVTGFLSHEWNERGGYYTVRMRHAHAWVEAYVEPLEWVSFDPTPRPSEESKQSGLSGKWREFWDYTNLRWNRYILSYDFERQKTLVISVSQKSNRMSERLARWYNSSKTFLSISQRGSLWNSLKKVKNFELEQKKLPLMGLFGAVPVVFFGCWLFLRNFNKKRQKVWFYPLLIEKLEDVVGPKPSHKTIGEFYEESKSKLGEKASVAGLLIQEYQRLRFHPSPSAVLDSASIKSLLQQLS
jgi:hypothetical protein